MTNTWSAAGAIGSAGREWIRATVLGNGRAPATGGQNAAAPFANADSYDPATNTWAPTTAMPAARTTHTQTTLNDGRALVANGNAATAIVYDPAAATWTLTGDEHLPHPEPGLAARQRQGAGGRRQQPRVLRALTICRPTPGPSPAPWPRSNT